MSLKVYTASSWRNPRYRKVVMAIQDADFEVYDFQNPWDKGAAFNWNQVDASWDGSNGMVVSASSFIKGIQHPVARRGFESDHAGMKWADVGVLILPCGNSAHMEAGWFAGAGKPLFILLEESIRPELTYNLSKCCESIPDLIYALKVEEIGREMAAEAQTTKPEGALKE